MSKTPKPQDAPPPIPLVTESAADIEQARRGQREAAAKRKGYLSTLLAGTEPEAEAKKNLLG